MSHPKRCFGALEMLMQGSQTPTLGPCENTASRGSKSSPRSSRSDRSAIFRAKEHSTAENTASLTSQSTDLPGRTPQSRTEHVRGIQTCRESAKQKSPLAHPRPSSTARTHRSQGGAQGALPPHASATARWGSHACSHHSPCSLNASRICMKNLQAIIRGKMGLFRFFPTPNTRLSLSTFLQPAEKTSSSL